MAITKIKFGTDGWRAIIAQEYTTTNVARVAQATATWLNNTYQNPAAVVGYDCRFGGLLFATVTAKILCNNGIKVFFAPEFVSTPMVSLGTLQFKAQAGIVITASHNPPTYNGYKLKADFGGPAVPETIKKVEDALPDVANIPATNLEDFEKQGLLECVDLETAYIQHIAQHFDLQAIRESGIRIGYDAMYGAGQNVMKKLFPNATFLHCDYNPSFKGQAPEPIHKNLLEFSQLIKTNGNVDIGIANDGDADRIGVYDNEGNFVDSHHIILLLIHYLYKYKGLLGKVVIAFSVTDKVKKLCEHYELPYEVTKIGFKHICKIMIEGGGDILLGGEESGGIATIGHIPERDGIWMGLLLLEFMAKTRKSIQALIAEIYEIVGSFAYERDDLHLPNELKWRIMDNCKNEHYQQFGKYVIQKVADIDGYRFYFSENEWVMIRPSGTEPVLRVYAEAPTPQQTRHILDTVRADLVKAN